MEQDNCGRRVGRVLLLLSGGGLVGVGTGQDAVGGREQVFRFSM